MTKTPTAEPQALGPRASQADLDNMSLDLEVTSVCDAVCGFCPREFMPDKKSFISMDLVERLADDIRNKPGFSITLCGIGESTLHPQFDTIVRVLVDAGAKVDLTTNGGRMTPERFEELATMGMAEIHFSLNAASPETHHTVMKLRSFEKISRNLQEILELKHRHYPYTHVHVSFVVCDLNYHEVDQFVEFWRPRNPTGIWLHPLNNRAGLLSPAVKAVPDLNEFKARYAEDETILVDVFGHVPEKDGICKIAHTMTFISVEGEMRLCAMDYRRVTSYGNLRDHRLHEMHFDKIGRYARGELDDFCRGCDFCPSHIAKEMSTSAAS